jgi:hypothetical protein
MRILVRAPNPGGRGRVATVLKNRGLLVDGTDVDGPFTNRPVDGLRIVEIGPITITPAVLSAGPGSSVVTPAVVDTAYHANIWIVEPLKSQIRQILQGDDNEDEGNTLFQAIKTAGTHKIAEVVGGIKSPEGYTTANNVTFMLPRWVASHRSIWC